MARRRVEARLEALVAAHRVTIAVVFPAVGAALLVASERGLLPPALAFNPSLVLFGTLVMRLPLLAGVLPVLDRRGTAAVVALTAYAYAVEFVGVHTGVPYGEFSYGVGLGPMLFDAVPLGLPVFFLPLAANSYLLVLLFGGDRWSRPVRLLAAVGTLLAVDLVLDPAAVALGFWTYAAGGPYYGVPWTNYAGWLVSGGVAVALLEFGFDRARLSDRLDRCRFMLDDFVSFTLLWGGVNAVYGNWLPVAVAAVLLAGLAWTDRADFRVVGARRSLRP